MKMASIITHLGNANKNLHFVWVRMANIKKTKSDKSWEGGRGKRTVMNCWWECKSVQPLWKTEWRFFGNRLKIGLPYGTVNQLLKIYLNEMNSSSPNGYSHVYYILVYNSEFVESALLAINGWINQENTSYLPWYIYQP